MIECTYHMTTTKSHVLRVCQANGAYLEQHKLVSQNQILIQSENLSKQVLGKQYTGSAGAVGSAVSGLGMGGTNLTALL